MKHDCAILKEEYPQTRCKQVKRKWQSLILVSPTNPVRFGHFKSNLSLKREQERHLRINRYAIHPFSKFRGAYEIVLVFVYLNALIVKPMCSFFDETNYARSKYLKEFTIMVDLVCWIDIVMTFFTGFIIEKEHTSTIELRFPTIAKHYILSPYFICDVLSSFPKGILYYPQFIHLPTYNHTLNITIDVMSYLKIVRIISLFRYVYRSALYLQIKSKMVPFFSCIFLTTLITIHWAACLQYGVARLTAFNTPQYVNKTWIARRGLNQRSLPERYNEAFFKGSALILGIRLTMYDTKVSEEYVIALITYFIGKLLVAFVWLLLAVAILNARSIHIKFFELVDQLEEYMKRKKLPMNLKERISQYYNFKYQRKYFKEELIKSLLPDNIKREVTMHICKTMIKNVSIFSDLSYEEITNMVERLVPEIFLPQDIIIQHGTYGDAMYFLSSGTVAVYTRSGKEICHLQDGAYFGEVSLLIPDQMRNTTIVAIETSQVYKLDKRDFERYLLKNKKVLEKIMQAAEDRLREAALIEEQYKKLLFEQQMTGFK